MRNKIEVLLYNGVIKWFLMKDFKKYSGEIFKGDITIKLDGVQAICNSGVWTSRANKALYNLPPMPNGVYEYFRQDWNNSVSDVRTQNGDILLEQNLYRLDVIDKRLVIEENITITPVLVGDIFDRVFKGGHEGLVLIGEDYFYKVKNKETYDVKVTGYQPGTKKHLGRMGALLTDYGKVGTGFTDAQREVYTEEFIVGRIIEVSCMSITPTGKFRHPVFVRLRIDK